MRAIATRTGKARRVMSNSAILFARTVVCAKTKLACAQRAGPGYHAVCVCARGIAWHMVDVHQAGNARVIQASKDPLAVSASSCTVRAT